MTRRPPRRLALTAKAVSNFYKGSGVGSTGRFVVRAARRPAAADAAADGTAVKWRPRPPSGFRIDPTKVRTFVAPSGWRAAGAGPAGSVLTPFVPEAYKPSAADAARLGRPNYEQYRRAGSGPASGALYLSRWKAVNGRS